MHSPEISWSDLDLYHGSQWLQACKAMNGKVVGSKPLYVAMAQRKEDRRAQLASMYLQKVASMRMQNPNTMQNFICAPNSGPMYVAPNIQGQGAAPAIMAAPQAASIRPAISRWGTVGAPTNNLGYLFSTWNPIFFS